MRQEKHLKTCNPVTFSTFSTMPTIVPKFALRLQHFVPTLGKVLSQMRSNDTVESVSAAKLSQTQNAPPSILRNAFETIEFCIVRQTEMKQHLKCLQNIGFVTTRTKNCKIYPILRKELNFNKLWNREDCFTSKQTDSLKYAYAIKHKFLVKKIAGRWFFHAVWTIFGVECGGSRAIWNWRVYGRHYRPMPCAHLGLIAGLHFREASHEQEACSPFPKPRLPILYRPSRRIVAPGNTWVLKTNLHKRQEDRSNRGRRCESRSAVCRNISVLPCTRCL